MCASVKASRVAGIGGGVLAAAAGLAGLGAVAALRLPLPRTSGRIDVPGLTAPVEVVRDRWGVPHIYARNNADLFMAQGYIHAQDRLWQMELHRRIGHGRLAEIFGALALEADRFLRVLGFSRVAQREAEMLDADVREAFEAYARGVNAHMARRGRRLPFEFMVLRFARAGGRSSIRSSSPRLWLSVCRRTGPPRSCAPASRRPWA